VGSALSRELVEYLDAYGLMMCGAFSLFLSALPARRATLSVPPTSRGLEAAGERDQHASVFAGFQMVLSQRYLILMFAFVIMLNLVNTTGEYLLAAILESLYLEGSAAGEIAVDKGTFVGRFYSTFYFVVNLLGVLIQFFLVSRLLRWAGFEIAFALTPVVVFLGYAAFAFLPVLALFRYYKMMENSLDYSLQNTARQMLYLPLNRQQKYEARAVIDPFGQRIGDLLQAGLIFIGLHWIVMSEGDFMVLTLVLAGINLLVVLAIIRERRRLLAEEASSGPSQAAPQLP
jgi:AAA family ATP:ADP antiporter